MLLTQEQISDFKKATKSGKIIVIAFDLETSPSLYYGWDTGKQYVSASQLKEGTETRIITAQYKRVLIDKKSLGIIWKKGNDSNLVKTLVPMLNKADIVIAQNGKAFDIKVLQERAKLLRLPPVNIDFMIDTLMTSRASVKCVSHSLDYRSKQYGLGGKIRMSMSDWIDIMECKVTPEKKMLPYGLKDNDDLEEIFWRDLPYMNLSKCVINKILKLIGQEKTVKRAGATRIFCKHCAKKRQSRYEVSMTPKGEIVCNNCGEVS